MSENNLQRFNDAARSSLAAGETVHQLIIRLLQHVGDCLSNLPPPRNIDLPEQFDLRPDNDEATPQTSIYDFVKENVTLNEGRKRQMDTWFQKFIDCCNEQSIEAQIFKHGSVMQGTAVVGSDLDISIRFEEGTQKGLADVLEMLKRKKDVLGLNGFIGIVGKACPTIKCSTTSAINIDITDGGVRQLALCCGHFIREVLRQRTDAVVFIKILKQVFMKSGNYGGSNQCPGGVAYSLLVFRAMQQLGVLPAFQRFDHGDFGVLNEMFDDYWNENAVFASTDYDITDEALTIRFSEILVWLIDTNLSIIFSLTDLEMQNPTDGIVIFSPPNNYQNVGSLVSPQTRLLWIIPELKRLLKKWKENPLECLESIV
uniref:Polymerase nucleotidyl transferase domain-containing protein n=1 Tax=Panagrolaimus superbus TaxID=310955 RepID=A0A914Z3G1_9BILA